MASYDASAVSALSQVIVTEAPNFLFKMTICAVKTCHNKSEKHNKSSGVTFHRFPIDPIKASPWINILRLSRKEECWKPTKSTRICSKHFEEKLMYTTEGGFRRLHLDAVPTKELHISCPNYDISNHEEAPSTSTSQENTNDEEMPPIKEELQPSSSQMSPIDEISPMDDDMESIFDTPREASLRRQLKKKTLLHIKHSKLIKFLQQRNRRLINKNKSLKNMLREMKKKIQTKTGQL